MNDAAEKDEAAGFAEQFDFGVQGPVELAGAYTKAASRSGGRDGTIRFGRSTRA